MDIEWKDVEEHPLAVELQRSHDGAVIKTTFNEPKRTRIFRIFGTLGSGLNDPARERFIIGYIGAFGTIFHQNDHSPTGWQWDDVEAWSFFDPS